MNLVMVEREYLLNISIEVRVVECIKKFINIYKTLLLSTMSNDEFYQTNNAYDRFYPVVITGN